MRTFALIALLLPAVLLAQVETSTSIRGLVKDATGAAVPGAKVVVRNTGTNEERTTSTDVTGFYAFPSLVPGTYNVRISHPGFKVAVVTNRVAEVSESAQVDVVLQVGATSDSVTVSAAGEELLITSSAEMGGTISTEFVENIPLNGRDFFDLAVLYPLVSTQGAGNQLSEASKSMNLTLGLAQNNPMFRSSGIFAAGNRDTATNTSIDGLNVQGSAYGQTTPQQPPSAIQEMKVHVSGMNAEFGNGVAAVNVITKNGTNQLHGDLYEYFRNDKLDANNFFNNQSGRAKSPYRQNQFGGLAGGPIVGNKLFFFMGYEGLRLSQTTFNASASPPPPDIRTGDFSTFRPRTAAGGIGARPTIYNPEHQRPERRGPLDPDPVTVHGERRHGGLCAALLAGRAGCQCAGCGRGDWSKELVQARRGAVFQ
jgi:hypothetical protein